MAIQICDINIFRDGGSIEFVVKKNGGSYQVWFDTPFRGEPRALKIADRAVSVGDKEIGELLGDIDEWFSKLPRVTRNHLIEASQRKEAYFNPPPELSRSLAFRPVIIAREYVLSTYVVMHK